ncbi:uS14 family ribosomal protein [Klebsiella pneumoniae]|uniref:uS14 family ribosomal protein n=1 Tax=Klebsiella pneumoniae TaxID=573 RepID=UPI0034D9601F
MNQELAHEENLRLPRDASIQHLNNRCIISSRPRGILKRYRISRHFFRELADHNLLSGVAKAQWG